MKCDTGVSWPEGNKSPSLMHDCFLSYICGEVGDGAVAFFVETGVGVRFGVAICSSGAGADLTLWFCELCLFFFFWFKGALCRAAVHSDVYLLWLFVWGLIKDCSCATQGPWSECLVWPRVMYPSKGDHTQVMRRQVVNWSVACTFSPFTTDKWDNIRRSEVK